ncbi:10385_t:CDS:2, partial [Gigaspora rosea]
DNYFETCLKNWQKPYLLSCGAEFKTMNEEESIDIPKNAFKIDKYTSVETRLPLILVINVASISITDEGTYLENKDLPEEINFPSEDINIKQ